MSGRRHQLRRIPAVEKLLQRLGPHALPRPLVVKIVRDQLALLRKQSDVPDDETILHQIAGRIDELECCRIQPVINATGVVLHTNLGRAPLPASMMKAVAAIGESYSNLEFDLIGGQRGSRGAYVEQGLAVLCGAEAATVVNNCAAALVLILKEFTEKKPEVMVSRGELVQIGGGFRIPDILETSGARLREVGTTNRTSVADYRTAISKETAMILKVHRSNFYMDGFVNEPAPAELAALARKHRILLVEDLGSGMLHAPEAIRGPGCDPSPMEVLRRGADLVCFSGDKLMGGPQAGVIAGKTRHIRALKKNPFFRALRCDKLILTALQETVERTLAESAPSDSSGRSPLTLHQLLDASIASLKQRGRRMIRQLAGSGCRCSLVDSESQVGGGTLPRTRIPSVALDVCSAEVSAAKLLERLRRAPVPVIGTVTGGAVRLDLRTVLPGQDGMVVRALLSVLSPPA